MTRVGKAIRNMLERWLTRFHEGPEPPVRIVEEVTLFRITNPTATIDEWSEFAARLAGNAYRQGYARGYEWTERDLDARPLDDPEVLAEAMRHDWSLAEHDARMHELLRNGDPNDPLRGIPSEARAEFLDELGRLAGGAYRVVVVPPDEPPKP